jgi:hypothetical protein
MVRKDVYGVYFIFKSPVSADDLVMVGKFLVDVAQRARTAVAEKIWLENELHRFGFDRIDFVFLRRASRGCEWRRCPFQNPWRAFSFIDRKTCMAFSFDSYSLNSAISFRIYQQNVVIVRTIVAVVQDPAFESR